MIIDSCYSLFFSCSLSSLNIPVVESVMIMNLLEPHVLSRKRRDSKLQALFGAGATRVRYRPHVLPGLGTVSRGACLMATVRVPILTPNSLMWKTLRLRGTCAGLHVIAVCISQVRKSRLQR